MCTFTLCVCVYACVCVCVYVHVKLTEQARGCVTTADEAVTSEKWLWKRSVEASGERERERERVSEWKRNKQHKERRREREQPCRNEFIYFLRYTITEWHLRAATHTYSLRNSMHMHIHYTCTCSDTESQGNDTIKERIVKKKRNIFVTQTQTGKTGEIEKESQVSYSCCGRGMLGIFRRDSWGRPHGNNWRRTEDRKNLKRTVCVFLQHFHTDYKSVFHPICWRINLYFSS